jgi:SPP1 gp7 family putative phage head morphogenesis protein
MAKSTKPKTAGKRLSPSTKERALIVQQIVIKAPQRKLYDVGDWRTALRSADSGRVKTLYDLFEDILLDGILSDAVSKRIDAVTNAELTFQTADGEEVEEIADLMDTPAWEELLTQIMNRRIYGRSGAELSFSDEFRVEKIPAKHIDLKSRTILLSDTDSHGVPYEGDNHLLILGDERDYGLLLKAAPYAIYKRGGFGDWSQWIELFGMPQRVGKYNTYDPESRRLLEDAFEKAGSAPYIVIPKEADVETKETSSGSGSSFNEFRQACNEEMLITVLGQTMTTIQGEKGARSLGEVHKEVEEGKNRSDMRFVQRVLNRRVLPMLEARGYPVAGGKFVFPKAAKQLTVSEIVQLSDIIDIPQSYLHETLSIPAPQDGEPVARRSSTVQPPAAGDEEPEGVQNSDRSFFLRLWDFFVAAPSMGGATHGKAPITLSDGATFEERLAARIAGGSVGDFDTELFRFISDDLLGALHTAFKGNINNADIAYNLRDDAFITALEQNLFHFSAGKTLAEVQELNRAFKDSKDFADFRSRADKICTTFNKRWQKTEYETALLTAESASNYRRLAKKKTLYPFWKYVIVEDGKAREEHQKLNGIILPADDPRWDKIFPPNGWKCRCRVVPVMRHEAEGVDIAANRAIVDAYLGTSEWKMNASQGWDVNRGKRSEIFTKNQMYVRKFPSLASKIINKVPPTAWGVESSIRKLTGSDKPQLPAYTGTPEEWWNARAISVEGQQVLGLKDYAGRTWQMGRKDFETHTTDKVKSRAYRREFLSVIEEVMSSPDEVWLTEEYKDRDNPESRLNLWLYIKYYEGKAIACACKLEGEKMKFKTWYDVGTAKVRKGLLLKKR